MSQENKAYIVQLVKQIVHPYFAGEIADILIAHGMTFKTEQQTNADRIRAMSDEELAKVMERMFGCPVTGDCKKMHEDCNDCWLDWLQQPQKGE